MTSFDVFSKLVVVRATVNLEENGEAYQMEYHRENLVHLVARACNYSADKYP
jgi:hypothetical protein